MNRLEAVIFDWAGTTVDFGCMAPVQAFIEGFKKFGIVPTMEEVREPMGMLKIDHIRTMLAMPRIKACWEEIHGNAPTDEDAKKIFEGFEANLFAVLDQNADVKPGVVEAVHTLRENGVKIGSTTGYTDKMMDIIVPIAKEQGYEPDCMYTPDSTSQKGRPYPYMIFKNMETLGVDHVQSVLKVGDTTSDIKEGKNAGVWSAGIVVGSSEMGLTLDEYNALSEEEKQERAKKVEEKYKVAGADFVFQTIEDVVEFVLNTRKSKEL